MNRGMSWLGGLGLGAGLMYLFDPDKGYARRSRLRDKAAHAGRLAERTVGHTLKDTQNRIRGCIAETASQVVEYPVSNDVLSDRVRARIGHLVTHAHPIHVSVNEGVVTLEGPVPIDEVDRLLRGVAGVRGVGKVLNRLQMTEPVNADASACCNGGATSSYLRWAVMLGAVGLTGAYLVARGRELEEIFGLPDGEATASVAASDQEPASDQTAETGPLIVARAA